MREIAAIETAVGGLVSALGVSTMSGIAAAREAAEARRVRGWVEHYGERAAAAEGLVTTLAGHVGRLRGVAAARDEIIAALEDELADVEAENAWLRARVTELEARGG